MKKFVRYPTRDAITNYFPLPNEIFSLGLSAGEIAVYSYLMFCEDRKTFRCYPSYRSIGKAVGMSINTVRKYVKSLEDKLLITTMPTSIITKRANKQNGSLLYNIRPIEEAIQHNYAEQLVRNEFSLRKEKLETLLVHSAQSEVLKNKSRTLKQE